MPPVWGELVELVVAGVRTPGEVVDAACGALVGKRPPAWAACAQKLAAAHANPEWLAHAYESMLAAATRQTRGVFYTPLPIARNLVALAQRHAPARTLAVLDPACGTGRFLVASIDAMVARGVDRLEATCRVHGVDIDPWALQIARTLAWWPLRDRLGSPDDLRPQFACGDALQGTIERAWPGVSFDFVVGNPPFLNQLEVATARGRGTHPLAAGYADTSAVFLAKAIELAKPGGVVAMIQPQSILSARDAGPIRRFVHERGRLAALWHAGDGVFDASTHVCAPVIVVGSAQGPVERATGPAFDHAPAAAGADAGTWAPLVADLLGVPEVTVSATATLADYAEATADFRDQYYGLRGAVIEDAPQHRTSHFPPLVTTGLVDAAVCHWGPAGVGRGTRFDKLPYAAPRVDIDALEPALRAWARQRLVPKIILATQTPIIECVADRRGEWLPAVPLITITPSPRFCEPEALWLIAAILLSPATSAEAMRRVAGSGLSRDAIKLSAKQAMLLPAPQDVTPAWRAAAALVRRAHMPGADRRQLLIAAAPHTLAALGVPERQHAALTTWWIERLR